MNTTNRLQAWSAALALCATITVLLGINALAREAAQPHAAQTVAVVVTSAAQV